MRRLGLLAATCVALLATLAIGARMLDTPTRSIAASHARTALARPNVVVVMVDDQPALDRRIMDALPTINSIFVQHGVTFSDFHAETPLCCPARAGFLTGQHTHNHHVTKNNAGLFNPTTTIATALHGVGYWTELVGKYMNRYGVCKTANCAPIVPPGWDRWAAFGEPDYYDYDLYLDGAATPAHYGSAAADFAPDVITQRAIDMITSAPSSRPLFAWIAYNAPHEPTLTAPRHANSTQCAGVGGWKPPSFNEADVSDKPLYVRSTPLLSAQRAGNRKICESLLVVDDGVARIRDALAATGRLQDTIFVYTGDNGVNHGEHRMIGKQTPYVTNIPFSISWPARVPAPRTVSERVQNIDFAPTICAIAGCVMGPYPNGQKTPDGISFASLLLGTGNTLPRDAVLDEQPGISGGQPADVPPWEAVWTTERSPLASAGCTSAATGGCRWHYIEYDDGERELYDDSNGPCWTWTRGTSGDPCELQNIVNDPSRASLVATLHARLLQLETEKGQAPGP